MKEQIARSLLAIGAVELSPHRPFVWTSGIEAPIYCDNRLTLSYPALRKEIAQGLAHLIQTHYPQATIIAGTATAGIPHAAWVADLLELPMIYVRSKAKSHGKQNQIEGKLSHFTLLSILLPCLYRVNSTWGNSGCHSLSLHNSSFVNFPSW